MTETPLRKCGRRRWEDKGRKEEKRKEQAGKGNQESIATKNSESDRKNSGGRAPKGSLPYAGRRPVGRAPLEVSPGLGR